MPPTDKKKPYSDEIDVESTDPGNLFTGSGSHMFANEKTNTKNPRVSKLEAENARQRSELAGIGKDLLTELQAARDENGSVHSYLANLYAAQGKNKISEEDVRVEFRARELNLQLIKRLEQWTRNKMRKTS